MQDIENFYDEYVDKVYKFFYIKCLNRSMAEDLTSETFVSFMDKLETNQIDDHKKYLYGIMRNVWLEFLKAKYKAQLTSYESIENFEQYAHQIIDDFEASEEPIKRLMPYVQQLPEKQRMVVMMRVYQDMSIKDTAQALDKDNGYVKTTYNRAIKRLRELLSEPILERKEAQ